jgi:hypothetical protein
MKYLILSNYNNILKNFSNQVVEEKDICDVKNLNYLLKCTNTVIALFNIKEEGFYLKSIKDIHFKYSNKQYTLKTDAILDIAYVNYFGFNKEDFMRLKVVNLKSQEEIKEELEERQEEVKEEVQEEIKEELEERQEEVKEEVQEEIKEEQEESQTQQIEEAIKKSENKKNKTKNKN